MWIGIQHRQQRNFFSTFVQTLGHFQRNQASKRETYKQVRTVGLQFLDGIKIKLGHIFDALERLLHPINALRLHAVDGMR